MTKHWITPDWPVPASIKAATTLRTGGVSQAPYYSFNLAEHVNDNAANVAVNRSRLAAMLALPTEPKWLQQVHSDKVVEVNAKSKNNVPADASYTIDTGVVCAVLTADCLPILLCDVQGEQIAAIHAGWRGLLAGIIENTVTKFQSQPLLAWLGPAIGVNYFQVGDEVRVAFIGKSETFATAFTAQKNGKWLADIYQLARIILKHLSINDIYGGDSCTVSDTERFYSYRRDEQTGRMATLIWKQQS